MAGLVVGALLFGAAAAVSVAVLRGADPAEALPAVQAMGVLFGFTAVGLGAYGATQGGLRRQA